jgi:serine kinase of HPr protein (carbohydrate metabolism regulator)
MNFHGTAFILGDKGVLVRGRSGAGKTTLALSLIEMCVAGGRFACLVSDDQVLLRAHGGRLVCTVPESIAGLAEFRGIGPGRMAFEPRMVVDLVVNLVERDAAPRYSSGDDVVLEGCRVPCLQLPKHEIAGPGLAILRKLADA